jgi:NAD(P)-dependent dehydrogenase (short-subunit alcohol dehydrogenase family)
MPTVQDVTSNTKIAIITGGSRGLGRNSVLSLAKRGVHAIFTYNSSRAEAEEVVGLLGKAGQKAVALELDAGNVGTFDNFVEKVRQALGISSTPPASRTTTASRKPRKLNWTRSTMSISRACSS